MSNETIDNNVKTYEEKVRTLDIESNMKFVFLCIYIGALGIILGSQHTNEWTIIGIGILGLLLWIKNEIDKFVIRLDKLIEKK